jgi:hypothetical protein
MAQADEPDPCEVIPHCPVCASPLEVAHNHSKIKICVCKGCGTSLTIPNEAFLRARMLWASQKQTKHSE